MKKLLLIFMILISLSGSAQPGTYNVGNGGNYATLTSAVEDYNNGMLTGTVTFLLTDDLYSSAETFPIVITSSGNPVNPLTIMPAAGIPVVISGSVTDGPIIDLNGANHISIDGINSGGSSLTITNTGTGSNSTIRFINDATYDTIRNCTILGSSTSTWGVPGGNILFSTGSGTGNDFNGIINCMVGPAGTNYPSKGICSMGSTTSEAACNSENSIVNCTIYDYFSPQGICSGIAVLDGNTMWTIENNKVYQSAQRYFTGNGSLYGIIFKDNTFGNRILIKGNTVGYSSDQGTGTLEVNGNNFRVEFVGIYMTASAGASEVCIIRENLVSDIILTASSGPFYGIFNGTGRISSFVSIANNTVRNMGSIGTTEKQYGIFAGSAASLNVNGNLITNLSRTTANTLSGIELRECENAAVFVNEIGYLAANLTGGTCAVYGIGDDVNSKNYSIFENQIHHLSTTSPDICELLGVISTGRLWGGNKSCNDNIIHDFSGTTATNIKGITFYCYSDPLPAEISGNTIYNFNGNIILGIEQWMGISEIRNNTISHLSSNAGNTAATAVNGIVSYSEGETVISNNLIGDLQAPHANAYNAINGISLVSDAVHKCYYNTVAIDASSDGTNFGTSGIFTTFSQSDLRNNIIVNTSEPQGTGLTCALRSEPVFQFFYQPTSNNNLFYAGTPGPSNLILYDDVMSYQTLADYQSFIGPVADSASVSGEVVWLSSTGTGSSFLHVDPTYPCVAECAGAPITGFTTDHDGNLRNPTSPDIGADEYEPVTSLQWNGSVSNDWTNPLNWTPNFLPGPFTHVYVLSGYVNQLKGNATGLQTNNLVLGPGTTSHVNPGSGITVHGNLILQDDAVMNNLGNIDVLGNLEL